MKKILGLFASISIVSITSANVVSCWGKTTINKEDLDEEVLENLLFKFNSIVQATISTYFANKSSNFIYSFQSSLNNDFFNSKYLQEIAEENDTPKLLNLTDQQKVFFNKDIEKNLNLKELQREINLSISRDPDAAKLKQFVSGGTANSIVANLDKVTMTTKRNSTAPKDILSFNLNFEIRFDYKYIKANGFEDSSYTIKNTNVNILSNETIVENLKNSIQNLPNSMFYYKDSIIRIKETDIADEVPKGESFKKYFPTNSQVVNYFNNEAKKVVLADQMEEILQKDNGTSVILNSKSMVLGDSEGNFNFNKNQIDFRSLSVPAFKWSSSITQNLLLRKNKVDIDDMAKEVEINYKNILDVTKFQQESIKFFQNILGYEYERQDLGLDHIYGGFEVSNLKVTVDEFIEIPISTFFVPFTYGLEEGLKNLPTDIVESMDHIFDFLEFEKSDSSIRLWNVDSSADFWVSARRYLFNYPDPDGPTFEEFMQVMTNVFYKEENADFVKDLDKEIKSKNYAFDSFNIDIVNGWKNTWLNGNTNNVDLAVRQNKTEKQSIIINFGQFERILLKFEIGIDEIPEWNCDYNTCATEDVLLEGMIKYVE